MTAPEYRAFVRRRGGEVRQDRRAGEHQAAELMSAGSSHADHSWHRGSVAARADLRAAALDPARAQAARRRPAGSAGHRRGACAPSARRGRSAVRAGRDRPTSAITTIRRRAPSACCRSTMTVVRSRPSRSRRTRSRMRCSTRAASPAFVRRFESGEQARSGSSASRSASCCWRRSSSSGQVAGAARAAASRRRRDAGDPRRGARHDAAGRVRCELRQGAAGAGARPVSRRPATCRPRAACCRPRPSPMWRRRSRPCSTSRAGSGYLRLRFASHRCDRTTRSKIGRIPMISRRTLLSTIAAAPLASALPRARLRRLSGQAGARDRAVRGRRQCGFRRAAVRRGHEPGARPALRGRIPHRRGRQPRRRDGGARRARRLHAVHRLERAAHRQSVRAGQAQLRSAEGFRRDRARQPRAALHRGARVGAGEDRAGADRAVEGASR